MFFFFSFTHTPTTARQPALYLLQLEHISLLQTTLNHLLLSYPCITHQLNLHLASPARITPHRPAAGFIKIKQNPTGGESHHCERRAAATAAVQDGTP
jgi:hypothetical protein